MINKLYNMAHDIPEKLKYTNKYTFLGYNKVLDIKYLDVNDVLTNFNTIPIATYISTHKQVLLIPNKVDGEIVDLYVRPLNSKDNVLKLGHKTVPYNIGQLSPDFSFGDVLILVEGIGDLGALKLFKRDLNIISLQSSKLPNTHYNIIAGLTNKVIILTDSDKAGDIGAKQMIAEFKNHNVTAIRINQFGSLKDTGDVLDMLINYSKTKDINIKEEIELIKMYYISQIYTQFT